VKLVVKVNGLDNILNGIKLLQESQQQLEQTIASDLLPEMRTRIHTNGLASDGTAIGTYSTKPLYINTTKTARKALPPVGKTGKSKFDNGQPHKTTYFASGYKQYKSDTQGTTQVRLFETGQTANQFKVLPGGLGWDSDILFKRAKGLEKHFFKLIWGVTPKEVEQIEETANTFIDALFKG